ncbi:hypothetical protein GCM10007231_28100 [Nocardioides daphniae]|uniref:Uncharacterized protein n=1 Tax=Nocardioides daphniae TaxID=402297 RepID=A0ABQ1QH57_9ACTN|nr:hypothetical protein GCM10007231_28100 [Nocardioides daphniae]
MVGESVAIVVEGVHPVQREVCFDAVGTGSDGVACHGEEGCDGYRVAGQGVGQRFAAGSGLGQATEHGAGGDAVAHRCGERAVGAGVEVAPLGGAGPEAERGADAEGGEPEGEVLAEPGSVVAVGGECDEPDRGAGLGVTGVDVMDRVPCVFAFARSRGDVEAGDGSSGVKGTTTRDSCGVNPRRWGMAATSSSGERTESFMPCRCAPDDLSRVGRCLEVL